MMNHCLQQGFIIFTEACCTNITVSQTRISTLLEVLYYVFMHSRSLNTTQRPQISLLLRCVYSLFVRCRSIQSEHHNQQFIMGLLFPMRHRSSNLIKKASNCRDFYNIRALAKLKVDRNVRKIMILTMISLIFHACLHKSCSEICTPLAVQGCGHLKNTTPIAFF